MYRLRVDVLTYDKRIHFHALSNGALSVKGPFLSLTNGEALVELTDSERFGE